LRSPDEGGSAESDREPEGIEILDRWDHRHRHEEQTESRSQDRHQIQLIPLSVKVTIVADRGFCDHEPYWFLEGTLGFEYIIRFRGNILVTDGAGECRLAKEWVGRGGRMRVLRDAL
jgi:hypothetical protein